MSRIRSVKPEWLEDELALACSDARVLSIGLMLLADDHGRGRAHPDMLLARVFPGKTFETLANALEDLARLRYMVLYEVDGQKYFAIRSWAKHQKVDHPGTEKVPGPESESVVIYSTLKAFAVGSDSFAKAIESLDIARASRASSPNLLSSVLPTDPPDRLGAPRKRRSRVGTWRRVPEDWQPTDEHRALASGLRVSFELELAKFRDHEFAAARKDANAAFRNWLRAARPAPIAAVSRAQQPRQPDNGVRPSRAATEGT
jgi:hypothetical protein